MLDRVELLGKHTYFSKNLFLFLSHARLLIDEDSCEEDTCIDIGEESPFSPLSKDNPEDEKFIHELQTIVEEFCNNLENNILVEEHDSSDGDSDYQFHSYVDETTLYDDSEFLQIRDYLDSEIQEMQHSIPSSTFPGDDSPNQGKACPETPLFPKATITVGTSMLLILSYSLRHGLSAVALTDLLLLISLHCPAPSFCTKTLALFRRFFRDLKIPMTLHQHCSKCLSRIETPKPPPICQKHPCHILLNLTSLNSWKIYSTNLSLKTQSHPTGLSEKQPENVRI